MAICKERSGVDKLPVCAIIPRTAHVIALGYVEIAGDEFRLPGPLALRKIRVGRIQRLLK
jgi:hypothetical protein